MSSLGSVSASARDLLSPGPTIGTPDQFGNSAILIEQLHEHRREYCLSGQTQAVAVQRC